MALPTLSWFILVYCCWTTHRSATSLLPRRAVSLTETLLTETACVEVLINKDAMALLAVMLTFTIMLVNEVVYEVRMSNSDASAAPFSVIFGAWMVML